MKEGKHILLITYYWPPSGGAGVQRWLKMLNYLSEENVKCTVLTVDPEYASYPVLDESLASDVSPNIRVVTTRTREPLNAYKKVTQSKESPYAGFANEANPSKIKKLARWVRANFFIPDARKGWNKFAYKKALELIKTEKFDALISTSPPHSTQLIGLKLKRKFSIPWIADLRDPWTDIYYSDLFPQTKWAKKKDLNYEKSVLENADNVIVVSQSIKELFLEKGTFNESTFHVIPNGFDHKDFSSVELQQTKKTESLRIAYTGTMSEQYPINAFVSALTALKSDVELHFAGKITQSAQDKLEAFNLNAKGFVPHNESISELQQADALLLIIPQIDNNHGILTGKLFEYLGARKPIIFIGPPEGDAAKIVNECECGRVFDYNESDKILEYLQELIAFKSKNQDFHTPNNEEIIKYSRKSLALEVKNLLNTH